MTSSASSSTAIVTGASRGIGKQIALELGRRGMNVVVAARTVEAHRRLAGTVGETVEAIRTAGGTSMAVRTDMAVPEDIAALVRTVLDTFGRIDVLVNNAAQTAGTWPKLVDMDVADWRQQFETNLHGPMLLMKAVVPAMTEGGGGVIVNMTSGAGDLTPVPPESATATDRPTPAGERVAYSASKAALNRLANVLAPELRAAGIAVVNVDPGFTRTELVDLMGAKGVVDADAAVPMDVPMRTVVDLVTSGNAMRHTGRIIRAADYVAALAP
ncbi:SDR family NAD(P)-dependent oxidoreductase [Pseudonocardia kunmingensis]|uniref:Short-subunit dehydrogenase n=1 Tax=Pseudonocardia kunmingensis TaxID=630975 RepID=A0A543DPD1_9PSEU|nr:SDR family oxidoreductase [Pseudonocardia kunmingensis]TQM11190.1 short-subunit dehydrogenase [Pseudonocardia kunmingensis]